MISIRPRRPDDLPACVTVLRQVHLADGYPQNWPADPAAWLATPALRSAWVGAQGEVVAGHVSLFELPDGSDLPSLAGRSDLLLLSRLFVAPDRRGDGLAWRLLRLATEQAGSLGQRAVLEVEDGAAAAIRLYERAGWRLLARRPGRWLDRNGQHPMVRVYLAGVTPPAG